MDRVSDLSDHLFPLSPLNFQLVPGELSQVRRSADRSLLKRGMEVQTLTRRLSFFSCAPLELFALGLDPFELAGSNLGWDQGLLEYVSSFIRHRCLDNMGLTMNLLF